MNENEKKSVWVVGGGFAGLAAAAALRQLPNVSHVTVLERCTEQQYYHTETAGAAAQLGPNGLRALKAIGGDALVARVLEEGEALTHIGIVLPNKDQTVMVIPDTSVQDTGLPQLLIRWGVVRRLLQELVPKDSIHTETGEEICGYAMVGNDSDHLGVVPVDAQGKRVGPTDVPPPSLIVVADGIDSPYQSLVRMKEKILTGPDANSIRKSNVQDNGRVNVKAVVAVELNYDAYGFKDFGGASLPRGTALAYNAPDGSVACFAGSAGGGGYTYWAISVADTVDERGSVTKYFCQSNAANAQLMKNRLLGMLKALNAKECQFAIDLMEATDADKIYAQRSRQLTLVGPSFVSVDSKVVLLGDAAHAFSQSFGQGANFAFEDAATLGLALKKTNDWNTALQSYSDSRVGRCEEMFRRSAERITNQAKGEHTEDVFKWISRWDSDES